MDLSKALSFIEESLTVIDTLANSSVVLGSPRISCGQPTLFMYTGLIRVANRLDGFVCLSFTQAAVDFIISCASPDSGEITQARRERIVQEVTGRVASTVSKKLGDTVKVSVPVSLESAGTIESKLPYLRFCVPFSLDSHSAILLMALKPVPHGDAL